MPEPLLLLPGTLCDARLWDPLRERLGHPAVATPVLRGAETAPAMAARLLREAPRRFALAGFSLGGIVALEMAAQAPERIARLAILSGNARPDPAENAPRRWALLEAMEREGVRPVLERTLWPSYVAAARQGDAALRRRIGDMAEALGTGVLREQTGMVIHRADSRPRLPDLPMPVLAVTGEEDALCPPDRSEEIAAAAPRGRVVILPGTGHFAPLEAPEALAAALSDWLAAPAPAGAAP